MTKNNNLHLAIVLCGTLLAAACQSASPTEPTPVEPEPQPVTLTGTWSGSFTGMLIVSDMVTAILTQTDNTVTGDWSSPMPMILVGFGAPAEVNLQGPVTGTVTGTMAELSFGFLAIPAFEDYFAEGCALSLSVSSFTETMLDGTWTTNMSCQRPVIDMGTMTLTRQ